MYVQFLGANIVLYFWKTIHNMIGEGKIWYGGSNKKKRFCRDWSQESEKHITNIRKNKWSQYAAGRNKNTINKKMKHGKATGIEQVYSGNEHWDFGVEKWQNLQK